jgi:hypothetical protein
MPTMHDAILSESIAMDNERRAMDKALGQDLGHDAKLLKIAEDRLRWICASTTDEYLLEIAHGYFKKKASLEMFPLDSDRSHGGSSP